MSQLPLQPCSFPTTPGMLSVQNNASVLMGMVIMMRMRMIFIIIIIPHPCLPLLLSSFSRILYKRRPAGWRYPHITPSSPGKSGVFGGLKRSLHAFVSACKGESHRRGIYLFIYFYHSMPLCVEQCLSGYFRVDLFI